jgi:signal transduction histidine kinase
MAVFSFWDNISGSALSIAWGKRSARSARLPHVQANPRLEKRLKDFAYGGLCLLWKRQSMYFFVALLAAIYVSPALAVIGLLLCQCAEVLDYFVSKAVVAWTQGTHQEALRFRQLLLLTSTLNASAVAIFSIGFALLEGPVPHQMPLFILFASGLFAAVNNHQVPRILLARLIIYGAAFLFIPIYDLWLVQPSIISPLWLQLATAIFVLYFVVECAQIFLRLYRENLDQLDSLRQERDRARAANDVKSKFVSTVSHELRTPLTSIGGSLELLGNGVFRDQPEKAEQMLDIARRNCRRLGALVNDLLDLQKLDSDSAEFRFETVDLNDIARHAAQSIKTISDKHELNLLLDLSPAGLFAKVDEGRIGQVLTSLLSNAIKFSNSPAEIHVTSEIIDKFACVSVEDHGIGIPDGSEGIVFGRFTQVDGSDRRNQEGTGLGLSIAKTITEQHGGFISFQSTLGAGTKFTMGIPLP